MKKLGRSAEAANGLLCPICRSWRLEVVSSRHRRGTFARVRKCENGHRFSTTEEVLAVLFADEPDPPKPVDDYWFTGFPVAAGHYQVLLRGGDQAILTWSEGVKDGHGYRRGFGWQADTEQKSQIWAWREVPAPPASFTKE